MGRILPKISIIASLEYFDDFIPWDFISKKLQKMVLSNLPNWAH
jgi:hypothetical protein